MAAEEALSLEKVSRSQQYTYCSIVAFFMRYSNLQIRRGAAKVCFAGYVYHKIDELRSRSQRLFVP